LFQDVQGRFWILVLRAMKIRFGSMLPGWLKTALDNVRQDYERLVPDHGPETALHGFGFRFLGTLKVFYDGSKTAYDL
jgi:hypothetical protein